ncbi:sugar phosphate isomerase/epimerase family protein [Demequina pelophila]|uniref:sugar phosphate isomerase/epimerase family protein n=1 Tax=Demequina pelophila TaxID=1638984 RepID=UPI000784EC05|nr:sugar phosphate isomerase/epimerase family protein [Demequina pelophila]
MDPTMGLPRTGGVPLGIHAGVWGFSWGAPDAARAIRGAAEAGFDFIEIPASPEALADPETTLALLVEHGMGATVSLALDEATDITSASEKVRAAGEDRLRAAVKFAAAIGAPFVGGVIHSAMTRYRRIPSQANRDRAVDILARVADHAAPRGVTLGVEYVNRYESNLLTTAADTAAFVRDIGRANVRVHLDTFHAHVEETSVPAAIAASDGLLGYVHASESHRGALGTGALDWNAIADALVASDFHGPVTVETFSPAVVSPEQTIEIALWRTLWQDPDRIARDSAAFLRTHLAGVGAGTPVSATSKEKS